MSDDQREPPVGFELRVKYTIAIMFVSMIGVMVGMFWYTNSAIERNDRDLCAAILIQANPDPPPSTERGREQARIFRELARKKHCA